MHHLGSLPMFDSDGSLTIVIETPRGSLNKLTYVARNGYFELGAPLPLGAVFPFDFGFVPGTRGGDGDPLDVLVLVEGGVYPGVVVHGRLVGVIEAEQTERDGTQTRNDRLIAVAEHSRLHRGVQALTDLPKPLLGEIEHFFTSYNEYKGKTFAPLARRGAAAALRRRSRSCSVRRWKRARTPECPRSTMRSCTRRSELWNARRRRQGREAAPALLPHSVLMTSQALQRQPSRRDTEPLRQRLAALEREAGANALAIVVHDTASGEDFGVQPDRWFHAASTIKVAILLGVFGAFHRGTLFPQSRVHVRNRFYSAFDGCAFRVQSDRDANSTVHSSIGKTMRVGELAHHMIVTSSNLATNLLLDLVGVEAVQRTLDQFGIEGIDLRRGVEDERAFQHGISNRVTARGLASLLQLIVEGRAFTPELSEGMLAILHEQEFRSGIPAQLPKGARIAHKTGEISTVAHDAGIVYPPAGAPFVIAVLTEWDPEGGRRMNLIARASRVVYDHLAAGEDDA